MIDVTDDDLSAEEEKLLRKWIDAQPAKIFLKVLAARTKRLQVQAMKEAQNSGEGYSAVASDTLKRAREAENFSVLLQLFMEGKEKLTIVKLS